MRLKDIAEIRTGLVLSRKKGDVHDDSYYEYRVVTLKAFGENGRLLKKSLDTFIADEKLPDTYLTQHGDILVRLREPNRAVLIDKEDKGTVIPSLVAVVRTDEKINREFLTHYLNSKTIQRKLQKEAKGTTISMIKTKDLSDLRLALPSYKRQEQIVSFLRLANQEIALLETLKKLKTDHKEKILDMTIDQGDH